MFWSDAPSGLAGVAGPASIVEQKGYSSQLVAAGEGAETTGPLHLAVGSPYQPLGTGSAVAVPVDF